MGTDSHDKIRGRKILSDYLFFFMNLNRKDLQIIRNCVKITFIEYSVKLEYT